MSEPTIPYEIIIHHIIIDYTLLKICKSLNKQLYHDIKKIDHQTLGLKMIETSDTEINEYYVIKGTNKKHGPGRRYITEDDMTIYSYHRGNSYKMVIGDHIVKYYCYDDENNKGIQQEIHLPTGKLLSEKGVIGDQYEDDIPFQINNNKIRMIYKIVSNISFWLLKKLY